MPKYTETEVMSAIQAVHHGQSIRSAAQQWGIPSETLRTRILGVQPKSLAFCHQQKVPVVQETRLAEWVATQSALGHAPSHQMLQEYAQSMLQASGEPIALGKKWVSRFLRHHPQIKVIRKRAIDFRRINGAQPEVIRAWFQRLQIPAVKAIKPENRWDFDEAGIMEGRGSNGLVLGSAESASIRKKQPGSRTWTSFLECVSATGRALLPLVIFKGRTLQQQWFPLDLRPFEGWKFVPHLKGWICDETALEWLRKVFLPNTIPEGTPKGLMPSEPRLLVCDGYGSHVTDEFMLECCRHNVYVLYLPAHTSHVLQPLDIAVFGPLKTSYRKTLSALGYMTADTASRKRDFLSCYEKSRREALMQSNIIAGWRGSGLWPINAHRPLTNPLVIRDDPSKLVRAQSAPPDSLSEASQVVWETPRTASQLRDELRLLDQLDRDPYTKRVLFRKLSKAFSEKASEVAAQQRELEVLRARLENFQTRKRKKVEMSPNSKFASIQDVYRTQKAAGGHENSASEISDTELSSEAESCIVVGGRLM